MNNQYYHQIGTATKIQSKMQKNIIYLFISYPHN